MSPKDEILEVKIAQWQQKAQSKFAIIIKTRTIALQKMRWNQKIRAGALQFVLFIGVVITLLLLTFVTLAHSHSLFGKKSELFVKTIKMADLGLAYALEHDMPLGDTIVIDLPFEDQVKLKAIKTYWGIF